MMPLAGSSRSPPFGQDPSRGAASIRPLGSRPISLGRSVDRRLRPLRRAPPHPAMMVWRGGRARSGLSSGLAVTRFGIKPLVAPLGVTVIVNRPPLSADHGAAASPDTVQRETRDSRRAESSRGADAGPGRRPVSRPRRAGRSGHRRWPKVRTGGVQGLARTARVVPASASPLQVGSTWPQPA